MTVILPLYIYRILYLYSDMKAKTRIVEREETAVARQGIGKHDPVAADTQATFSYHSR
jgi:hypothetical protein